MQFPHMAARNAVTLALSEDAVNLRAVAETGVDAISVGSLTHSAPAMDLSMLLSITRP